MAKKVAIGIQNFEDIIKGNCYYVDKTYFIKEWWDSKDSVTLITRPRRFGKTLNMSMIEQFFSVNYADRGELFEGLSIWKHAEYREIQGTYPVIFLSFASVKEIDFETTMYQICTLLKKQYERFSFLQQSDKLSDAEREYCKKMTIEITRTDASMALHQLSDFLYRYYGKKVIILLDEYDTPMQEAYVNGFWDELAAFTRSLFNATFKTNPYLERAMMTGITRISKESVFSDLNNLKVITTTSDEYATAFGFTQDEVTNALREMGITQSDEVKRWYDGFMFGSVKDIYNPWSIINFLDTGKFATYWANTSENSLIGKLVRESSRDIKEKFENLLKGEIIETRLDEQIVYNQLEQRESAIWSLLLASGYLKVVDVDIAEERYQLKLTNYEILRMFQNMISGWFEMSGGNYNEFVKALLMNDLDTMNELINRISCEIFSYFDTGKRVSKVAEPERFYHGLVLGLLVELQSEYILTSNRESGYGRYDVMLEPRDKSKVAYIFEFKVHRPKREASLEETVENALKQIEEKQYEAELLARGMKKENIYKYGFAFCGKEVLIGC